MKAKLIGFKKFTSNKNNVLKKWVSLGVVFNDINAVGGMFANAILCSDENDLSASLVPGGFYSIDFDNRGQLLGIEKIKE